RKRQNNPSFSVIHPASHRLPSSNNERTEQPLKDTAGQKHTDRNYAGKNNTGKNNTGKTIQAKQYRHTGPGKRKYKK
ncbi:MAG TPA: hypothetical protein DCP64_08410, partial [Sarcina sp.]|nr:hypothetical protein [Sarcina sp.]